MGAHGILDYQSHGKKKQLGIRTRDPEVQHLAALRVCGDAGHGQTRGQVDPTTAACATTACNDEIRRRADRQCEQCSNGPALSHRERGPGGLKESGSGLVGLGGEAMPHGRVFS